MLKLSTEHLGSLHGVNPAPQLESVEFGLELGYHQDPNLCHFHFLNASELLRSGVSDTPEEAALCWQRRFFTIRDEAAEVVKDSEILVHIYFPELPNPTFVRVDLLIGQQSDAVGPRLGVADQQAIERASDVVRMVFEEMADASLISAPIEQLDLYIASLNHSKKLPCWSLGVELRDYALGVPYRSEVDFFTSMRIWDPFAQRWMTQNHVDTMPSIAESLEIGINRLAYARQSGDFSKYKKSLDEIRYLLNLGLIYTTAELFCAALVLSGSEEKDDVQRGMKIALAIYNERNTSIEVETLLATLLERLTGFPDDE